MTITATDLVGNTSTCTATLTVPLSGACQTPAGLVAMFVAGILLLTALMHVARAIGRLHAKLAKALLVTG